MARKNARWRKMDNGWFKLAEDRCYPGTLVWVFPIDGVYKFKIINISEELDNDEELSRVKGEVQSKQAWYSPSGAMGNAMKARRKREWLSQAGIKFKE